MEKCIKKRDNKGFTLVELVVVLAILLVLASAVTISVIRYLETSRQAMDVHNASLIRDAVTVYSFPGEFQGRDVEFVDPDTGDTESFKRGWVYVDKTEIRCSDPSTALAMINAGLVSVSKQTESKLIATEEDETRWFPSGPDGDYIRKSGIGEYVFHNNLCVKAKTTWNTYQIDVYIANSGELYLGASASNAVRTGGHAKDEKTAQLFAGKLGLDGSKVTPIGEQNSP